MAPRRKDIKPKKLYKDDETFKGQAKRVIKKDYREKQRAKRKVGKASHGKYDKSESYRAPFVRGKHEKGLTGETRQDTKKSDVTFKQEKFGGKYKQTDKNVGDLKKGKVEKFKQTRGTHKKRTAGEVAAEIQGVGTHTAGERVRSKKLRAGKGATKTHSKGRVKVKTFDLAEASDTRKKKTTERFDLKDYDKSKSEVKKGSSLHERSAAEAYGKATTLAEKRRKKHEKDGKAPKSKYGGFDVTVKTKTRGRGDTAVSKSKYKVRKKNRK